MVTLLLTYYAGFKQMILHQHVSHTHAPQVFRQVKATASLAHICSGCTLTFLHLFLNLVFFRWNRNGESLQILHVLHVDGQVAAIADRAQ